MTSWLWMAGAVMAADPPPIPERDPASLFKDVPAPWRDYFSRAREAERLDDSLERCLAYPDLPGNRWPDGHAAAHCRFHALKSIPITEIEAYLQRGGTAELDSRLAGLLARHFAETGGGEDIDVALKAFNDANADSDRVSARWLELAPESAYANFARAEYFRDAAWNARGGKWAAQTPRERMRQMTATVEQALPLYRKAIRLEPALMPAYAGLLNVAMLDSRPDVEREAVAGAMAIDPACLEVARLRMNVLQPRWGGSYEDMLELSAELSRYIARRPQLAIHVAAPYGDRGDRLVAEKQFTREAAEVLDIAVRIGSNEAHLHDAADVALNPAAGEGEPDRWKGIALLLQEYRFNELNAWGHRQIAWQLARAEPEWSLRHAMRADELEPGSAWGHYLLGASNYNARRFEDAERHYLLAAEDVGHRQASLLELSEMLMFHAGQEHKQGAARAKPHVDRLLRDYPENGRGWLLRLNIEGMLHGMVDGELVEAFLRHADPGDPVQARAMEDLESARREATGKP